MSRNFIAKNKTNLYYGLLLGLLLFLLSWLEFRFVIFDHSFEIYIGAIAVIFTLLGIWLAMKLTRPKVETLIIEKIVYNEPHTDFILNQKELAALGISKRELDVLQLMAEGFSNQEIGKRLFVSLNTIKTHSARIFEKLEVERRTQAVEKAKRLRLIP